MKDALEIRLANARAALDEKEWLTEKLKETGDESRRLDNRVDELEAAAKKEQGDVDSLEGFGLQSVLHAIIGGKEAKLEKERGEAIAAKLKYEAAKAELLDVRARISKFRELIEELGDVKANYEEILAEQKDWLVEQGGERGKNILNCAERQGHLTTKLREMNEAIEAAHEADNIMEKMLGYLREARGWGYADIAGLPGAGGGPLSDGWNKYDAFGAAHVDAVDARHALSRLQSALKDVHLSDLDVELPSGFLKFADWFIDGLAADIFVQSKISASVESVEKTQMQVQGVLSELKPSQKLIQEEIASLKTTMLELLEK
jgi:chromosome segregation ATPase